MQFLMEVLNRSLGPCIITILSQLPWVPVCFQPLFKVLVLTFRPLYHWGPAYLKDCLIPCEPAWTLWSSLLHVPLPSEIKQVPTQERAFLVMAPKLCIFLPREIHLPFCPLLLPSSISRWSLFCFVWHSLNNLFPNLFKKCFICILTVLYIFNCF